MKRFVASTGLLVLVALGLAAAVWDGSAIAGVAGDFPGDGLYGACNSFPRDTSVTVTNLENGKTVSVIITNTVDNPGVFIALSPKAAAEIGMRAGSAARIRAVALTASQAETSLPPTRAGETADPDYNPKVYVEREKAAIKAAAAAAPSAVAAIAQPAAAANAVPKTDSQPAAIAMVPETLAPQSAEVFAREDQPSKQPSAALPSLSEPRPSGTPIAAATAPTPKLAPQAIAPKTLLPPPAKVAQAIPAQTPKAVSPKLPADALPMPEESPAFPGSPRPSPLGMNLPSPDLPSIPAPSSPNPHGGYLAQAPEILGGVLPQPRKPAAPRLAISDPPLPAAAQAPVQAQGKKIETASVNALAHPTASVSPPSALALAEPKIAPDQLPEAILSRIIAPSKLAPVPVLADAAVPEAASSKAGLEAIALERPSYAAAVAAAALAEATPFSPSEAYSAYHPGKAGGEGAIAELPEAELPGSPEAIADRKAAGEGGALSELQVPDVPRPSEGLAAPRPLGSQGNSVAALDEPGTVEPSQSGAGPIAIGADRPSPGSSAVTALGDPEVPAPSESLVAGRPNAVEPGQAIAELAEPSAAAQAAPGPASVDAVAAGRPALAVSPSAELESPVVPSPESIAAEGPAAPPPGELSVTLEPAEPRPPAAANGTVPAPETPKGAQPAAVATVKGPTPSGSAQPPASIPIIKGLSKGSFYVQIGVYGTNDSLQSAIAGFKSNYPLAVERLTTKTGAAAYRLFVGPLGRDESGVVLIKIRSLGFKDAYVRQGS